LGLAIRAFRNDCWVGTSGAQDSRRHHPGLNQHIPIFDRHVSDFISNTREFLDDVHVGRMEEAPSSQPRRIDE
jgi:hypothetical protein